MAEKRREIRQQMTTQTRKLRQVGTNEERRTYRKKGSTKYRKADAVPDGKNERMDDRAQ